MKIILWRYENIAWYMLSVGSLQDSFYNAGSLSFEVQAKMIKI